MLKQATFAHAGTARITVKFIAVTNLIPACAAFYGSIDELKHLALVFRELSECPPRRVGYPDA